MANFFRKHGKSPPNDRQDHHVLVVDVVIMTSQCKSTRALSRSYVTKHDNHVPVTPWIGSGTGWYVDATAAVWQNYIGKQGKSEGFDSCGGVAEKTQISHHRWTLLLIATTINKVIQSQLNFLLSSLISSLSVRLTSYISNDEIWPRS